MHVTKLHVLRLKRCIVVSAALLLCACANMPSFLSGGDAAGAAPPAPYVSTAPVDPAQTHMTRHDIMLEWGTLPDDRGLFEEPGYTLTIEQIMTNAACHSCDARPYHRMVVNASNRYGVSVGLIHAVIQKESSYNPSARSKRRARGLMQVTPATARFVGIRNSKRLYDPQTNIYAGTAYLKYLLANHATVDEALAAYNSGPGNVRKYKGVPPFTETRRYVRDVKRLYLVTSQ
jgi:soluble lytic murein transglycosylase-like protein